MNIIKLTTAQALVKFLDNQYVEFDGEVSKFIEGIFTIFGHGNVLGLGQALEEKNHSLKVYQGRNEQGMAHAATAFAKQNKRKKIMACTSSVGPGSANMVTAAATASANRIPLLLLPGDVFASRQPDPVLQQIEQFHDLTISTNDVFKPVSKYWDRVSRPEQLMTALLNAMRVLTDPVNTGAVTISLPQDVQGENYEYPLEFFKKRIHRIERTLPTDSMIKDAVEAIKSAKKPMLICGGGVKYSEAEEIFKEFSEMFNIPFGETQAGKGAVSSCHNLNLGGLGTTGNLAANRIARDADLVIGVGTRYTDFTTASKWIFQNQDVKFLNINIAGFDSQKLDGIKITADAGKTLKKLKDSLENSYRTEYKNEIKDVKELWEKEWDRLADITYGENFIPEVRGLDHVLEEFKKDTGSSLTQTNVLGILNKNLENSIVVGAAGSLPGDLQRMWKSRGENDYHVEYGYSCMGYEISGALGVKMAEPTKEVYALVGDGSYQMLHSELVTSIQEKQKINIILMDNMAFGCINNLQMGNGMGSFGTEFRYRNAETGNLDGELIPIDFAMNARSYGCKTYNVKNEKELIEALEDSKKQTVSTLIDIKVLPKTMTDGYDSWWHVGNASVSDNEKINKAYEASNQEKKKIKKY